MIDFLGEMDGVQNKQRVALAWHSTYLVKYSYEMNFKIFDFLNVIGPLFTALRRQAFVLDDVLTVTVCRGNFLQ